MSTRWSASNRKRHGLADHPLHPIWRGMHTRCTNPRRAGYENYGARGIKVCERWQSFTAFLEDMEAAYRPGLTLEREDNDGDYTPNNCRWATRAVQNRNRRSVIWLETPWGRLTLTETAAKVGVTWQTMQRRVRSWPADQMFMPPTNKGRREGPRQCASR